MDKVKLNKTTRLRYSQIASANNKENVNPLKTLPSKKTSFENEFPNTNTNQSILKVRGIKNTRRHSVGKCVTFNEVNEVREFDKSLEENNLNKSKSKTIIGVEAGIPLQEISRITLKTSRSSNYSAFSIFVKHEENTAKTEGPENIMKPITTRVFEMKLRSRRSM